MGHDWVFDVLADLRAYARSNGLPALAEIADEALKVAMAEITAQAKAPRQPTPRSRTHNRRCPSGLGQADRLWSGHDQRPR